MRKRVRVAIICAIVIAIAIPVYLWQSREAAVDSDYISELHTRLDPGDIPQLKEIITTHPDNYVRERAIFTLADIAVRKDVAEDVIDFLKDIAYNEENDEVRSAAYANLDFIREFYPLETKGELTLRIEGEIREGNNITIIATASSTVDVEEATVGIRRMAEIESEETGGIHLSSRNPVRFVAKAGESKEIPFEVELREEGEYLILCVLELDFDRVDYQIIEKGIFLTVGKTEGTFQELSYPESK